MILNQYCVLLIFIVIICNIQFISCNCFKPKPKIFADAEEFEVALKHDTGFSYLIYPGITDMDFLELKRILIKEDKPKSFNLQDRAQIIYYDLYCGNLYNLLEYMSHISNPSTYEVMNKIITNDYNKHDITDHLILDELVIQQMLCVILKTKLEAPLDPLWNLYMYAIYQKKYLGNDLFWFEYYDLGVIKHIRNGLSLRINEDCKESNKYSFTYKYVVHNEQTILKIKDVVKLMLNRNNRNNMLLNNEEVENWVSLRKIYLCQIIEEEDIIKTIIIHFGEQSEKRYEYISQDINNAYENAKICTFFHEWILNIGDYQEKILNIFRFVALHLMRKHLFYAMSIKTSNIIKNCNTQMYNFLLNNVTLKKIFNFKNSEIGSVIESFKNKPTNKDDTYNIINSEIIKNIVKMIDLNTFDMLEIDLNDSRYNENSIQKTKELLSNVNISKENHKKIQKFKEVSCVDGLHDNFLRINIFLEYFENIFKGINFKMVQSFMQFSSNYKEVFISQPLTQHEIKLDL